MACTTETMSPRQRWLAAMKLAPVDRLPFWPKLDGAYARAQDEPFRQWSNDRIHQWIGSDPHVGVPGWVREVRTDTDVQTRTEDGVRRTVFRTTSGQTQRVDRFDPASQSWHPVQFPVRSRRDIALMTEIFSDVRSELDPDGLDRARQAVEDVGDDAVTVHTIGESPLMYWVEWLAGVEGAHYFLADHADEVQALFDAQHRRLLGRAEVLCEHSPCDLLYFTENTSTTLISPAQYRRHCLEHIRAYAEIARRFDRLLVLHMCGHLKAILGDLDRLDVAAFEAFTSPTVGNTRLADGREACPGKCLVGGTNAALWTRPADEIIAEIAADLDALPHHRGLVVTSAGVMPPRCTPDTIRQVCRWVQSYPARM